MKAIKRLQLIPIALLFIIASCSNILLPTNGTGSHDDSAMRVITSTEYYDTNNLILHEEEGILEPGAAYKIILPPGWITFPEGEKRLILYAHGYVTPGIDFSQSEELALIEEYMMTFVDAGIAVAYSHYSESGWAVENGSISTVNLRNYFFDNIAEPDFTYLWGVSEGALISVMLAEKSPELFDGVLAYAGPIGGAKMEFEYILNSRLAFDHFFKYRIKLAALYGDTDAQSLALALGYSSSFSGKDKSAVDVTPDPFRPQYVHSTAFITDMAPLIGKLMLLRPKKTMEMATVKVNGKNLFPTEGWYTNRFGFSIPTSNFIPEFAYTLATALWYNIYGTTDLLSRTDFVMPIDNSLSKYTYTDYFRRYDRSFSVEIFHSSPAAESFLTKWYQPIGSLSIPLVTLHMTRDPAVPYFHEMAYASYTGGPSPWLTQIPVPGFGHGLLLTFPDMVPTPDHIGTMESLMYAFSTLRTQVE